MRGRQVARVFVLVALGSWLLHPLPASANHDPELAVNHSPRIQLGDAPLAPFGGSSTDQVQVIWQTVPAGGASTDSFTVEYKRTIDPVWSAAGSTQTIDTGVGGRVNRYVDVTGLDYDTEYEYRVRHLSDGQLVVEYQASFQTRLPAGDTTPFAFAAYGDSAYIAGLTGFRDVMTRVAQVNPAFTLLLGDNVYTSGSHTESDARFDPTLVPEATSWIAGHVDYVGYGNHDVATSSGLPSEQNFAVPVPIASVTAPTQPPASERAEHNYSFDYGDVHFVTFDTNSLGNASRLDGQLSWVEADLQASTATWNIVFGHHPVAGAPDKPESPSDNYYQQVVPRLRAAGADLFMVGHSHTVSATYPLLGETGGEATFVLDPDADFNQGLGLVQVISGVGGRSLRTGSFSQYPFVRAGFSTSTATPVEYGFTVVDVTSEALTISYVAADDGAVLDQFALTVPDPDNPTVTVLASDGSAGEPSDPGEFTVTRSVANNDPLNVTYTVAGSASPGVDYQALVGTVTIPGGQTSVPVTVSVMDDSEIEGDEDVVVTIQDTASYRVGLANSATVVIGDDEEIIDHLAQAESTVSGNVVSFDLTATYVSDDTYEELREARSGGKPSRRISSLEHYWEFDVGVGGTATLFVEAYHSVNPETDDFLLAYSTDGTNFADLFTVTKTNDDDVLQSASIPGSVSGTIMVRVTDTDRSPGNGNRDSLFVDQLFIRSGGGTAPPVVSITANDAQASEPGTDTGEMTVSRSGPTSGELTVSYSVSGSATPESNYEALSGTVIIPVGSASATLSVTPIDDAEQEIAEMVVVTVDSDPGYVIGSPSSGTVIITDDDAPSVDVYATSETSVYGSVAGSLFDTQASDDSYEAITEDPFAGGKKSRLDHRWTFELMQPGDWVFNVEAFHDSAVEDMAFEYSTGGSSWIGLLTVTSNTDPDGTQSAALPAGLSGTVHVRVLDTDRSPRESSLDTLFVDHMYMRS